MNGRWKLQKSVVITVMGRKNFPRINYLALLVALGTDREIAARITKAGFTPPPLKTISGWRTRGAIPGQWAPLLIQFGLDAKIIKNVNALIGAGA